MKTIATIFLLFFFLARAGATSITIEYFGGNGTDTASDQQAFIDADNSGIDTIVFSQTGTYYLHQQFIGKAGKVWNFNGCTVANRPWAQLSGNSGWLLFSAASWTTATTGITVTEGGYKFRAPTTSIRDKIQVGKIVHVRGGTYSLLPNGADVYRHGWYSLCTAKNGDEITLQDAALTSFTSDRIYVFEPFADVHILNMRFDGSKANNGTGVVFSHVTNSRIFNCEIFSDGEKHTSAGASQSLNRAVAVKGVNITVDGCNFYDGTWDGGVAQYAINPDGQNITIKNTTIRNWKSAIISGSRDWHTRSLKVYDCIIDRQKGTGSMINFHGNGGGIIKRNKCYGYRTDREGIMLRGRYTIVEDNEIYYDGRTPAGLEHATQTKVFGFTIMENAINDLVIRNNAVYWTNMPTTRGDYYDVGTGTFWLSSNGGTTTDASDDKPLPPTRNMQITGNKFSGRGLLLLMRMGDNIEIASNYIRSINSDWGTWFRLNSDTSNSFKYIIRNNTMIIDGASNNNQNFVRVETAPVSGAAQFNTWYRTNCGSTTVATSLVSPGAASGNTDNGCAVAVPSAPIIPMLPVAIPSVPVAPLIVGKDANFVRLDITPSANSDRYRLSRSLAHDGLFVPVADTIGAGFYTDYSVSANTIYWYKVKGLNDEGESAFSDTSFSVTTSATPQAPAIPAAPGLSGTTTSTATIMISASANAAYYEVFMAAGAATNPYELIANDASAGAFIHSFEGATTSRTFFYKTVAVNAAGKSEASAASTGAVIPAVSTSNSPIFRTNGKFRLKL